MNLQGEHRADCCDNCGKSSYCTKIVARCWPDHSVAENCVHCRECADFQNQFIVCQVKIVEAQ